jgi:predicted dehydrogenase
VTGKDKRLNALIVGGRGVGAVHAEALRHVPDVAVLGVAGSSQATARDTAQRLGVPRWSGDYRQLVADPAVDVVHVCTPNDRHLPVVRDALAAGKHVVCEKPLAATVGEAEEMLRLAEGARSRAFLCYKYRYMPQLQRLRGLVGDGSLGEIHAVRGHYLQSWKMNADAADWRVDPRRAGFSPVLLDIGTHLIDLVEYTLGAPVTAPCSRLHPGPRPLPQANVLFRVGSALGVIVVSQVCAAGDNHLRLEIDGSAATATWTFDDRESLLLTRRADDAGLIVSAARSPRRVVTDGWDSREDPLFSTIALFQAIYDRIRGRGTGPLPPLFCEGLRHLRLFAATSPLPETAGDLRTGPGAHTTAPRA